MIEQLGRYEIIEKIGQGGFAIVYRARDTELDRWVALKELRTLLLADTAWVKRFRREARAIAQLDHPQIVDIYDVGQVEGRQFIVMRLVEGLGLDELIAEQGPLPWAQTLEIMSAIAQGLDYAHAQGILHRDLKPANILIDPARGPLLSDFGFAKLVGENSVSLSRDIVGTPHYLAPEAWEDGKTTLQLDIYALGCILFEMLTGEKLFKGSSPPAVMMAHFSPPVLPDTWPEGVPAGVTGVLKKALARHPADRYASAGELVKALAALGKEKPAKPSPELEQPAVQKEPAVDRERTQPELIGTATASSTATPPQQKSRQEARQERRNEVRRRRSQRWSASAASTRARNLAGASAKSDRDLSKQWKGFLAHLGPYVIIIGFLAMLNLATSDTIWFIWPALGWGVGLAFHLFGIILSSLGNISRKWRGFLWHFGSYLIIIAMLAIINAITSDNLWFIFPALGWGAAVAIHFWALLFSGGSKDDQDEAITEDQQPAWGAEDEPETLAEYSTPSETSEEVISESIQIHLDKARSYKEQIDSLIKTTTNHNMHVSLQDLAVQMDDWIEAIESLARRVDSFRRNTLIHQDLETVPHSIEKLEAQLVRETDVTTRAELERTLTNRKNQLAALEQLRSTMNRAEIRIERTLSALGTIYPQLLTSQSTNQVADYSRLSAELDEEVRTLQDHLEALEEVKLGKVLSSSSE